ncbi:MAG: ATP-dependent RecD-like DNA helicase [Bradymonadia bacterium]
MTTKQDTSSSELSLTGVVDRVVFQSDDSDFAVAVLISDEDQKPIRLAGDLGDVEEGETVSVIGRFVIDPRFGPQLKVSAIAPQLPHTIVGIQRFLSSGRIEGIGPKLAQRLVDHFGAETIEVITNHSARLAEVPGIGRKRRAEITARVQEGAWQREAMIFLHGLGLGSAHALKIWKRYQRQTITAITLNPYRLVNDVRGIGFSKADQMALSLGLEPDGDVRLCAAVVHVLKHALDDGHVFLPRALLLERLERLIGNEINVRPMVNALIDEGRLVEEFDGVYLSFAAEIERSLAEFFISASTQSISNLAPVEPAELSELSQGQGLAVSTLMSRRVGTLTGGPGTGKTTTLNTLIRVFKRRKLRVTLAAPTGRAAKRMQESTGEVATTIHRLLGYHPVDGFRVNAQEPLDTDLVIVDEASMIDQNLMHALTLALGDDTRLILVGDADQLPSVGAGQVLKELIDSGELPTASLTEVFRQAAGSRILDVAHDVRCGFVPNLEPSQNLSDFYWVEAKTSELAGQHIETMIAERIPSRFGVNPKSDVQVLCPMHKGSCGTESLNQRIQQVLNPDGDAVRRHGWFRLGDRVIQCVNEHQKEVYNGDLGYICHQDSERTYIDFDGRVVGYMHNELDQLTLAYAVSIHKSQGSEYPVVIVPVLTEHWVMLARNLLYTAVTRGKRLVILVGQRKALKRAIMNTDSAHRYTSLAKRMWELVS